MPTLHLTGEPDADRLLSQSPLALLIGMLLDQQVPMETAFAGPEKLRVRLGGTLDARTIADADPESIAEGIRSVLDRPPVGGIERAAMFTWDECARRHDEVYDELMS